MTADVRRYEAAVSIEALALAWARQEDAPAGSTVVVANEISPRGRNGKLWPAPAATTVAMAMVLRPELSADDADAVWLLAGLVGAAAVARVEGPAVQTWWPDAVVNATSGAEVIMTKAEVQLGPGHVRSAVISLRFDLGALGIGADHGESVIAAARLSATEVAVLRDASLIAERYSEQCALVGRSVKLRLLPAGESRGRVNGVDRGGRLLLSSRTGMVERISIDVLRDMQAVQP